jgi:hypothetical protein
MFSKKKTNSQNQDSSQSISNKLEKMEIEQDQKSKKGKTDPNWQPWSFAHVQRISDEELWKWNQTYQQDLESRTKDQLLSTLKDLLLGNDPKEVKSQE